MKFVLLAAAAVLAAPAIAQTTPAPTPDQSATMPADQSTMSTGTAPTAPTTMPMNNGDMAAPTNQSMPMQTAPGTPMGTENAGGYQPSMPAVSGGTPGMAPTFRAAPSPSEAFPPPAPMADYPMCKKGQFDHCKQGPASTHSREVRGRR